MLAAFVGHALRSRQPALHAATRGARRQASYIDSSDYEKESDKDMNANLGKEVLLYVDEDVLVFSKPHNVQSAPGYKEHNSLVGKIAAKHGLSDLQRDQMVVHRLDYATSGVIVYARNVEALACLHEQFRLKRVYKRYSALVHGVFSQSLEGEIDLPLGKDLDNKPLNKVDVERGKPSVTQWSLVASDKARNVSLVHLRPMTGRTHQLRIHMSAIGHPILGDFFYAPRGIYEAARRLCLHAEELRFKHPRTQRPMKILDPCPFTIQDH